MKIKETMNQSSHIQKGNVVAMLAAFTEKFLLQHTSLKQPINSNLKNDLMADSISFVLSDEYEKIVNQKNDWNE